VPRPAPIPQPAGPENFQCRSVFIQFLKWHWQPYYSVTLELDRQALQQESLTDGVFPLITNLEASTHSAKRVLEIYKFQPFLEKRHSQLKTWQEITPVLLKKEERVIAYLHLHVMALMVATLIERQLRQAMNRRSLPTLPLYPEERACRYPTLFHIVRVFREVERYEVYTGQQLTLFPANLTPLQRQVLDLLEVPASLYL
jgi:transposase